MTVGVEDVGLAVTRQCLLNRFDAEVCLQRDRHPPGQHPTREPIQHDRQIDEAPRHGNISDIHSPDLIGSRHGQLSQQIGVYLVSGRRFRGVRFAIERLNPHPLHQCGDMQPPHRKPLLHQ